jgi:tetraacyldisaccharide 4'-kinase
MRRSPPEFWSHGGAWSALLAPAGWLFGAAGTVRRAVTRPWRAPVPVLCVGNLVVGGAGKTPVALDLAQRLAARGAVPHILTRGYGGSLPGPIRVDPAQHSYREVGDEALLLARVAPTWICADRVQSARSAIAAGATVLVLDDGFQNPSLVQDLKFLVVDSVYGLGNGRLIPAGPLREPAASGFARADAIVLMGDGPGDFARLAGGPPVLRACLTPTAEAPALTGARVVAFAGIGRPEKFFATLGLFDAEVVGRHPFPDHQPYSQLMLEGILAEAERAAARVVTTEKDWVRVPAELRQRIIPIPVRISWDTVSEVTALLGKLLPPQVARGRSAPAR